MNALHYLKFMLFHLLGLVSLAAILAGGDWISRALLAVTAIYVMGDAIAGDDTATPALPARGVLTAQLWLALPLLFAVVFAAVWSVGESDPFGAAGLLGTAIGYDLLSAREATTGVQHLSAIILTGLQIGLLGTIPAHELIHRTRDRVSMAIGRWLLAFSFDTAFAVEHVYGHHRRLATPDDPASAPRGRNVYRHIVASTIGGNTSAWQLETGRLRKRDLNAWSPRNSLLRGYLMSGLLVFAAFAISGMAGVAFFVVSGIWGKALLEIVNYMEHYGLVRAPGAPVEPRHSWNSNRRISSWSMFYLTRHSHHHANGSVQYADLEPYPEAPQMISGYLSTILIAMVPPLWHRLMTPKLLAWDAQYASEAERALAREANRASGIAALRRAGSAVS